MPGSGFGEQARRDSDLDVLGEDQDSDLRVAPPNLLGGAQALVGVRRWHPNVDDRDIGLVADDLQEQVVRALCLSDHVDPGFAQQGREPVADQQAVIGNHDPHGITAEIVVPLPTGCGCAADRPAPRPDRRGHGAPSPRRRWLRRCRRPSPR